MAHLKAMSAIFDFIMRRTGIPFWNWKRPTGMRSSWGTFHYINEGEYLSAEAEFTEHPAHGPQYQVTSYQVKEPEGKEAMERYLGSGAVRGIGPALAARIVKKFKGDTFRIFEEEPERLAEVKGISLHKGDEFCRTVSGEAGDASCDDVSLGVRHCQSSGCPYF